MLTAWITVLVCVFGGLPVFWAVVQIVRGHRVPVVTVLAVILLSVMATVLVIGQPGQSFGLLEFAVWPFMLVD